MAFLSSPDVIRPPPRGRPIGMFRFAVSYCNSVKRNHLAVCVSRKTVGVTTVCSSGFGVGSRHRSQIEDVDVSCR